MGGNGVLPHDYIMEMEDRALTLLQHPEWGERGTVLLLQGKDARQALLRVCSWERDLFPYYRMRIEDWALLTVPTAGEGVLWRC